MLGFSTGVVGTGMLRGIKLGDCVDSGTAGERQEHEQVLTAPVGTGGGVRSESAAAGGQPTKSSSTADTMDKE